MKSKDSHYNNNSNATNSDSDSSSESADMKQKEKTKVSRDTSYKNNNISKRNRKQTMKMNDHRNW